MKKFVLALILMMAAVGSAYGRAWLWPSEIKVPDNVLNGINDYTEVTFVYRNHGNRPALRVTEQVEIITLPVEGFRTVSLSPGRDGCRAVTPSEDGRPIFQSDRVSTVLGITPEETARINAKTHYLMIVGCFAYDAGRQSTGHSWFCMILEPIIHSTAWRTTYCPTGNGAE